MYQFEVHVRDEFLKPFDSEVTVAKASNGDTIAVIFTGEMQTKEHATVQMVSPEYTRRPRFVEWGFFSGGYQTGLPGRTRPPPNLLLALLTRPSFAW